MNIGQPIKLPIQKEAAPPASLGFINVAVFLLWLLTHFAVVFLVFRTLSPVFLHHPYRVSAVLLHLHLHSPGPPSVQAVPQSFRTCCGLTNHSSGGAFSHLHQPGPGDRRGAPRSCGLARGPPCLLKTDQWPCVCPSSLYCT